MHPGCTQGERRIYRPNPDSQERISILENMSVPTTPQAPEELSTYAAWHGSLPQVRDVDVLPWFPEEFRRFVVMDGFRSLVPSLPVGGASLSDQLSAMFRRRAVLRRFGAWVDSRPFVDACLAELLRCPPTQSERTLTLDYLVLLSRGAAAGAARTSDLGILVTVMSCRAHPPPASAPSATWSVRHTRTHEAEQAVIEALASTLVADTARSAVLYRAVLVLFDADPPREWCGNFAQFERLRNLNRAAELMFQGHDPWIGVRLYGGMCVSQFGRRNAVLREMLGGLLELMKQVELPPPRRACAAGQMVCFAGKFVSETSADTNRHVANVRGLAERVGYALVRAGAGPCGSLDCDCQYFLAKRVCVRSTNQ